MLENIGNPYSQVSQKEVDVFSDFMTDLNPNPITGDIVRLTDEDAVRRSVRNLVLTSYYERLNPLIGSGIRTLLFEPMTYHVTLLLKQEIKLLLENFEPRVNVLNINVDSDMDNAAYIIEITFSILNKNSRQSVTLQLNQIR